MDLPSPRELELETLLRQRDSQLSELIDELTHLRQSSFSQPGVPSTEPITLPPALVSVLSPHLHVASSVSGTTAGSNTVNAALLQRARTLQEENDELYDLLKLGETGKLKEEVRGLRRVVAQLESALRESHQAITTLSTELDKSYSTLLASSTSTNNSTKSISQSPRAAYHPVDSNYNYNNATTNGPSKLPPTGPRAYKKPRLSDAPVQQTNAPVSAQHKAHGRAAHSSSREYAPSSRRGKGTNGMRLVVGGGHGQCTTMDGLLMIPCTVEIGRYANGWDFEFALLLLLLFFGLGVFRSLFLALWCLCSIYLVRLS
ncbi:hypothetical protein J132_00520 [Termitomyces sp. J132]|nr:hypothetical protein J132_00520 [Termitomyces sp. J132]